MWPHDSSVGRNGGRLVPAACGNIGGAIVGPVVSSVVITFRRAGIALTGASLYVAGAGFVSGGVPCVGCYYGPSIAHYSHSELL